MLSASEEESAFQRRSRVSRWRLWERREARWEEEWEVVEVRELLRRSRWVREELEWREANRAEMEEEQGEGEGEEGGGEEEEE